MKTMWIQTNDMLQRTNCLLYINMGEGRLAYIFEFITNMANKGIHVRAKFYRTQAISQPINTYITSLVYEYLTWALSISEIGCSPIAIMGPVKEKCKGVTLWPLKNAAYTCQCCEIDDSFLVKMS